MATDMSTELSDMWPRPDEIPPGVAPMTPPEAIVDPIARGIRTGHATDWPTEDEVPSTVLPATPADAVASGLPSVRTMKDTVASWGVWGAVTAGVVVGAVGVMVLRKLAA